MNLRKFLQFGFNKTESVQNTTSLPSGQANVHSIEPAVSNDFLTNIHNDPPEGHSKQLSANQGLMNLTEISGFFSENFFGLGCHNGSNFRTHDALLLGKKSLISRFQNTVTKVIESKKTNIGKLKGQLVAIEGLSESMSKQLVLACEHLEKEITILKDQLVESEHEKGWVLEPINRYHLGYIKGLNEALEFDFFN